MGKPVVRAVTHLFEGTGLPPCVECWVEVDGRLILPLVSVPIRDSVRLDGFELDLWLAAERAKIDGLKKLIEQLVEFRK